MGSQTLEILRQGVWASLTGGWFYDPHEDLFCNTVHLYIWLFLLCVPFSVYLYFPPASVGWIIYCALVALLFISLKILNHALHRLYDTHEIYTEPQPPSETARILDSLEMRILHSNKTAAPGGGSDDESVTSLEYHKPNNSTIDLKVDVHRKNSSESSIEDSAASGKHVAPSGVTKSDLCIAQSSEASNRSRPSRRQKSNHKQNHRKTRRLPGSRIEELTAEDSGRNSKTEDSLSKVDEGPYPKVSTRYQDCAYLRSNNRDFLKEWLYLDGNEAVVERFKSNFARQLSLDPRETSDPNVGPPSPKKKIANRRRYANYPDESCTKSAMALATAQSSNMRRNSNSTMSTIQLPLLNSTAQLVSHMRRHSNNTEPGFCASVELGAYMMDKNDQPTESDSKSKGKSPGVRRIKSAALEICCPPPSVSNLSPHPNSAETIGGQVLKNPKNSVIPPPSKSLTRGPHLNLCPKNETGEGCSYPYLNYGSEIVYPIAEISDEMQTSQKETDLDSSGDSYSDYDDENNFMRFRGFDWDSGQQAARSSDSDYENNGSRSPLLDKPPDIKVVRSRTQDKKTCDKQNTKQTDNPDKPKSVRLKKQKSETQNETKNKKKDVAVKDDSKLCQVDYDKTSATSKELLIEKSSLESNENQSNKETNKKLWDQEISNSSTSIECPDKEEKPAVTENDESQIDIKEESSVYSLNWLFGEDEPTVVAQNTETGDKTDTALGETSTNIPKNLGAIPKQIKSVRSRTSSQKENKKKESKKENNENQNEEMILLDAVEAQAALVQGLECLFAATNANTVVMPNPNREERPRHRQHSVRGDRDNPSKARKRSIEEVAQTSTNTLLPTTMPLLAAFLSSRTELPQLTTPPTVEIDPSVPTIDEPARYRGPLMDRNHRNRVRKIKRSTRQRNQTQIKERPNENADSNNLHFATSFDDTSEGATHCFLDEHGNLMSYTFDKNSIGPVQAQPMPLTIENPNHSKLEKSDSQETTGDGSCASLESETGNENSKKRTDSIDQSSSNQGSNNPLIESSNNLSTVVPINVNTSNNNKRFYVFDGGTNSDQPRSPVAYVTDSLLEQIEQERQNRMGLPSMHINYLMNQQRARDLQQTDPPPNYIGLGAVVEEPTDLSVRIKFAKLLDDLEERTRPKPKSYYKVKLLNFWDLRIDMDRLKLMAMFDRNLSYKETFASILLAILVAVLGSMVLNLGFYRDIYAFWFCFIMAGSQYCLLKSVQPDASSPVHGFNKMVVFSRATYFCLCTAILVTVHRHLENSTPIDDTYGRHKRSVSTDKPFTVYGIEMNERSFLYVVQEIISKFLLFLPIAFSLGLFPQVNTFLMYLLEQIDMHIFGGNATRSLSAALYCVLRSIAAVAILYGFAYSGLVEGKKSQHQKHNILLSIFCALLVPIAYHLSRSASDYSMIWNLIKKHLLPPELYVIHNPECSQALDKNEPTALTEENKKNSESNISKQNSLGSSVSKVNFSSESNIARSQKKSQTSSVNSLKLEPKNENPANANVCNPSSKGDAHVSNPSLKEPVTECDEKSQEKPKTVDGEDEEMEDPLPKKLQATVNARLKNDLIVCTFLTIFVFGIHCTTVFTTLRPQLNTVLWIIACIVGWLVHYVVPQLRKQQPWLCLASPVLKAKEYKQFEMSSLPTIVFFEKIYVYVSFLERNVLYPAIIISATTQDAPAIAEKYGDAVGALIIAVCALKCLRNAYSETESQYLIVVFAVLLFQHDLLSRHVSETFLVDYFVTAIIFSKVYEFLLKIQFVVTYIAPWQITWGSAFHAFAQPFSVPHSAMLFVQAAISAAISSPLTPAIGSAIFMTSYVRPVKFWERDYNTKRVDSTNTRLSSQLERNLGADDNNLNSIFYEHLTRSLQHYLCGDLMLGRWGQVQQGDCFVLASDYLNCLVHIVEVGNGLVSFQLRGLEFRGTYCQQREVEAISEGPDESSGWWVGGLMLSPGWMFSLRWLSWQLVCTRYVLEGYSVSDNSAASMLQVFDFRKLLLTYYVKSIIYYTIRSPKLDEWLSSPVLQEALKPMSERSFVDLDPIFNVNLDEDYDFRASGITRSRFWVVYGEWTSWVWSRVGRRRLSQEGQVVSLVFALSLLGRRALAAAHHLSASSVEFFLYGLHSLFKGDFRITCARDEWVFTDMSLLHSVLAPAIRMALKLHQDHFMFPDEYSSSSALYSAICTHGERLVICHETQPAWRYNVLRGAPHLLALRHVMEEGSDDYKIIMLNKRFLSFRVIRLNRECVRGLWAGQQQELVYLRNRNPERGSIQNAKQALRNIINSSCDQPIGYPIYVSPLTTSYSDTSEQLTALTGKPLTASHLVHLALQLWRRIRVRCGEGCSSGGECVPPPPPPPTLHLSRTSLAGTRGSLASGGKPTSTLASLASLLRDHSHDRPVEDTTYTSIQEAPEPRRRSLERVRQNRNARARTTPTHRQGGTRTRGRRDRGRPSSFRQISTDRPDGHVDTQSTTGWDSSWRDQLRRAPSAKSRDGVCEDSESAVSSVESLSLSHPLAAPITELGEPGADRTGPDRTGPDGAVRTGGGADMSLPDCKIIANITARGDHHHLRRYFSESASKDISKPSKEIRHERDSYKDLTGRYTEKPESIPLKDISTKEAQLKEKNKNTKPKIKTDKSELKANISLGSKVIIVEPLGVYDCINMGRRIDVQWPSEYKRERGGRNYWGAWIPTAGMDGLVVHKWYPNHRDPVFRSHVDKNILLVQIEDRFVPIAENCVQDLGDEV